VVVVVVVAVVVVVVVVSRSASGGEGPPPWHLPAQSRRVQPLDLPGTSGIPRHEPSLTPATPLAQHRPPQGAAHGGRAEPRARWPRGARDGARRRQGATGRAGGVLCKTAVVSPRAQAWLWPLPRRLRRGRRVPVRTTVWSP
jgi:hypothetical protein